MTALTTLGRIAPPLAAEIAWRAWRRLGTPEPVHVRDNDVHARAVTERLEVDGVSAATYRWGDGGRVILLVHGWQSRASRLSSIVSALEGPDVTIIAFDAPGNGDSPGRFVTILDFAAIITELSRRHGPIDTIIGHSFGVLSSFYAVHEGVRVKRLVGISGMYGADYLVARFSQIAGLSARVERGLRRRIERRTFPTVRNPWRRFVAEIDPANSHVPVLLIHDSDDTTVDPEQAVLIAEAHTGPVRSLITAGLGHSRILSDPGVLAAIAEFVTAPAIDRAEGAASPRS